eukprot:g1864.t1
MSSKGAGRGCKRLEGKIAVVTASSLGIGFAIAQRLGEEGASVVVSSRKQDQVDSAVAKLQAMGLSAAGCVCHVGKAKHRQALLKFALQAFGQREHIDVLVSNAAVQPAMEPLSLDVDDAIYDKIFDTNVKSYWQLMKEARPLLKRGSSVVLVSSIGGYDPAPPLGLYAVSKTALFGLTKLLAKELAPDGIRVNCLAPGVIKTKFSKMLWESEEANEIAAGQAWLGRVGEPAEMAGAVAYMASDDASFMTGETMVLAGGKHASL